MDSNSNHFSRKPQAAGSAKPARAHPPVRLPQTTADLVDRMLSARCAASASAGARRG